jgi:hypothetical protein
MFCSVNFQYSGLKTVNVIFEMWLKKKKIDPVLLPHTLDIRKQLQTHVPEPLEWHVEIWTTGVFVCVCAECQSCVTEDK